MTALLVVMLVILIAAATVRMLTGHWMPVNSEHVSLDFRSLTLADIPIELIYGPNAVRHPYPLSEPVDDAWHVPGAVFPSQEPYWFTSSGRDAATMRAAWRIGADLRRDLHDPNTVFRHINPC